MSSPSKRFAFSTFHKMNGGLLKKIMSLIQRKFNGKTSEGDGKE